MVEEGLRQVFASGAAVPAAPGTGLTTDGDPQQFRRQWLQHLCRDIGDVRVALLMPANGCRFPFTGIGLPDQGPRPGELLPLIERAERDNREVVHWRPAKEVGAAPTIGIALPIRAGSQPIAVCAVELASAHAVNLPATLLKLGWAGAWLQALDWQLRCADMQTLVDHARASLDLVALLGTHTRLPAAALDIANELAAATGCDRVGLGRLRRGRAHLIALSHSVKVNRRSAVVAAIEGAMDEAIDQDQLIEAPARAGGRQLIATAHQRLLLPPENAVRVWTVVLRAHGKPWGALTFEQVAADKVRDDPVKLTEAIGAVLGPALAQLSEDERWIGGRAPKLAARGVQKLVGRNHPGAKLIAVGIAAALAGGMLVDVDHRLSARAVLEGAVQRAAVVPFDGFVAEAPVRAGDTVKAGQTLALLDTRDLVLERAKQRSEADRLEQKHREALAKYERPSLGVIEAQLRQVEAQLSLTEEKLKRARITAPIDGLVVSGDLSQMLGTPVEKGKVMFEIAPLDAYRVVLSLDERDMRYVAAGQGGTLILASMPESRFPIEVRRITSVTSVEEGRNVFRGEASLAGSDGNLRPGMEGVAKIEAGSAPFLWVWSRSLVDWIRLKLWQWTP